MLTEYHIILLCSIIIFEITTIGNLYLASRCLYGNMHKEVIYSMFGAMFFALFTFMHFYNQFAGPGLQTVLEDLVLIAAGIAIMLSAVALRDELKEVDVTAGVKR